MTAEEFEALKVGTTERRDAQVREVSNGFAIVAVRHFVDSDTATEKFSVSSEGVAADANMLLNRLEDFFRNGDLAGSRA